jgi:hypothetical protein
MRRVYAERHERIVTLLVRDFSKRLTPLPSAGGLHLAALLEAREGSTDLAIAERAAAEGVAIFPLSHHYAATRPRQGFLIGYGAIALEHIEEGLEVPRAPVPVPIDGRTRLVYELHVTNFALVALELTRIEVVDGNDHSRLGADFRDEALGAILGRPGRRTGDAEPHVIAPGLRAVVYLWLTIEASPGTLLHRLTFREPSSPGKPDGS